MWIYQNGILFWCLDTIEIFLYIKHNWCHTDVISHQPKTWLKSNLKYKSKMLIFVSFLTWLFSFVSEQRITRTRTGWQESMSFSNIKCNLWCSFWGDSISFLLSGLLKYITKSHLLFFGFTLYLKSGTIDLKSYV